MGFGNTVIQRNGRRIASPEELKEYARRMRERPTLAERVFRDRLLNAGIRFKHQKIIGFYIADFLITDRLVVVELDGGYHDDPEQVAKDRRRDEFIARGGIPVIRIPNCEAASWLLSELEKYPICSKGKYARTLNNLGRLKSKLCMEQCLTVGKSDRRRIREALFLPPGTQIQKTHVDDWNHLKHERHRLKMLGVPKRAARRGSRSTGTNPRALGTNPRALEDSVMATAA